jgi:hypothetical protein
LGSQGIRFRQGLLGMSLCNGNPLLAFLGLSFEFASGHHKFLLFICLCLLLLGYLLFSLELGLGGRSVVAGASASRVCARRREDGKVLRLQFGYELVSFVHVQDTINDPLLLKDGKNVDISGGWHVINGNGSGFCLNLLPWLQVVGCSGCVPCCALPTSNNNIYPLLLWLK